MSTATQPAAFWYAILAAQSFLAAIAIFVVQRQDERSSKNSGQENGLAREKIAELEDALLAKEREFQERLQTAENSLSQKEDAFKQEALAQREEYSRKAAESSRQLEEKARELQSKLDSSADELIRLQSLLQASQDSARQLQQAQKRISELESMVSARDREYRSALDSRAGDLEQLRGQLAKTQQDLAAANLAIEDIARLKEQAKESEQLRFQYARVQEQLSKSQEELSRFRVSGAQMAGARDKDVRAVTEAQQRITQLEEMLAARDKESLAKQDELKQQLEKTQAELSLTNKMHEGLKGQYDELEEKFTQIVTELEQEKKKPKPSWQEPPAPQPPLPEPPAAAEEKPVPAEETPAPSVQEEQQKDAAKGGVSLDAIKKLLKSQYKT